LLLVDAAYSEFSGQDFTPLLARENVLLLRTFSKLYAMAGVRVGYVLTSLYLAAQLQKAVSDFPLSVFAEVTAEVALEHSHRFQAFRDEILYERDRVTAALGQMPGVHVYPSGTNFLLVQLDCPKQPLLDHLLHEHSLLISDLAAYAGLNECVRISIGTPEQNDLLLRGFAEHLA
jgi:histidinol-phosphate aminotransferase